MPRSVIKDRTPTRKNDLVDLKKRDNFSRRVGLRIWEFECSLVPAPAGNSGKCGFYDLEPGYYFVAQVTGTRDGVPSGPYQELKFFKTPSEREAYINTRAKAWHKRRANA